MMCFGDREPPKAKFDKSMIGAPTNFMHTAHGGQKGEDDQQDDSMGQLGSKGGYDLGGLTEEERLIIEESMGIIDLEKAKESNNHKGLSAVTLPIVGEQETADAPNGQAGATNDSKLVSVSLSKESTDAENSTEESTEDVHEEAESPGAENIEEAEATREGPNGE